MTPSRFLLFLPAVCCLLCPASLPADEVTSPFDATLQYSADLIIKIDKDPAVTQRLFIANGNARLEMTVEGAPMVTIIRPDLKKFYHILVTQKAAIDLPYTPGEFRNEIFAAAGAPGKYAVVGTDTLEGLVCTKYKGRSDNDSKIYYVWVNANSKAPVKMIAEDGSFSMLWKNYAAGPQDAALFKPPADYGTVVYPPR